MLGVFDLLSGTAIFSISDTIFSCKFSPVIIFRFLRGETLHVLGLLFYDFPVMSSYVVLVARIVE